MVIKSISLCALSWVSHSFDALMIKGLDTHPVAFASGILAGELTREIRGGMAFEITLRTGSMLSLYPPLALGDKTYIYPKRGVAPSQGQQWVNNVVFTS